VLYMFGLGWRKVSFFCSGILLLTCLVSDCVEVMHVFLADNFIVAVYVLYWDGVVYVYNKFKYKYILIKIINIIT
jgi:hypothetical protein